MFQLNVQHSPVVSNPVYVVRISMVKMNDSPPLAKRPKISTVKNFLSKFITYLRLVLGFVEGLRSQTAIVSFYIWTVKRKNSGLAT